MKNPLLYISIFAFAILGSKTNAQNDISMATHWYNRSNYNPASIAKPDYIYLFTNVRSQWTGITGSPTVVNVQGSEYIQSLRSAFGLSMVCDNIGVTQTLNPLLTYAYVIGNDRDWWLSMGISAGIFSRSINSSQFEAENGNDNFLYTDLERTTRPDANLGLEFQNSHFILGLSTTHLFSAWRDTTLFLNANHQYGYFTYKNTDPVIFNYSLGLQVVNRYNRTIFEGNASIRFKKETGLRSGASEIFNLGLSYRSSKELTCMFGINITHDFRIGYAFDKSFIPGFSQNSTHEIMLEYRIPTRASSSEVNNRNTDFWYY